MTREAVSITHRQTKEQSEEVRRREAVRAQLAAITEEYKESQSKSRDALKQLKWAPSLHCFCMRMRPLFQ